MPFQMGDKQGGGYDQTTVSVAATHPSITGANQEVNYHNLNSFMQTKKLAHELMTSAELKAHNSKRPFLMSDSTFPGSGHFTGSWLSNYRRTWEHMRNSIAGVMNLNMFGVLLAGTEVCGSLGEFDAELCARWTQNAVLFPAVRNYYNETFYNETSEKVETNPKGELFNIDADTDYIWSYASGSAIKQRYGLIEYIYTQLYMHSETGTPYIRPALFDEPQSASLLADPVESSYLAGEALHVSTTLEKGAKTITADFPMGKWIKLAGFMNETLDVTEGNNQQTMAPEVGGAIIHLKEGKAIPYQTGMSNIKSTKGLLMKDTEFIAFRDAAGYAEGHLFLDDGKSDLKSNEFSFWKFRLAANTIQFQLEAGNRAQTFFEGQQNQQLRSIKIIGAADLKGTDFACIIDADFQVSQIMPVFNDGASTLELRTYDETWFTPSELAMIRFGDSTKETNICNVTTSYRYMVKDAAPIKAAGTTLKLELINNEQPLNTVFANFVLLDDMGTVKVTFTREDKPIADQTVGLATDANFKITDKTLKVTDFLDVDVSPFRYVVKNKAGVQLYVGSTLFFFDPESYYTLTYDYFNVNEEVGTPLFGLGGRGGDALIPRTKNGVYTQWNSANKGSNAYQPFYIYQQRETKMFVGVFDLATTAMDYLLESDRSHGEILLTHISTAPNLQKYFFTAETPDKVVAMYQKLVGMPQVPPEWAFGWGHYQEGISSGDAWASIPANYVTNLMVLDSMWVGLDYTQNFETLTVDTAKYGKLVDNLAAIHKVGVHGVPIVESGISMNDGAENTIHSTGVAADVFIKSADKKAAVGSQHGNKVNYPDVTNPATLTWWKTQLDAFLKTYPFDGLWLDKNDLYSDCSGYCSPYDVLGTQRPAMDIEKQIGYIPGSERLDQNSLDVSAMYTAGDEFAIHNKFPLLQAVATTASLEVDGKRPFLISSSTMAGQGPHSVSLTARNSKSVADMTQSVQDLYMANIYGMPFHGSDVCGFSGATDMALCARWYLLAAVQPFARYGNSKEHIIAPYEMNDKIPAAMEPRDPSETYAGVIRSAMNLKYELLRYTISYFHGIAREGGAYYKPMFFKFPNELSAYTDTAQNIMLGESLKFSFNPTSMDFGKDESHFFFPEGKWCQIFPVVTTDKACFNSPVGGMLMKGEDGKSTIKVTIDQAYVHMPEGAIVPITNVEGKAVTVSQVMDLPTSFLLGPPKDELTTGYLAFDEDGSGSASDDSVFTMRLTSQLQAVSGEHAIYLNFTQIGGTPRGEKYVPAESKSQNLGMITVFDVADLYLVQDYNVAQCFYLDNTGMQNLAGASISYDKTTENLSFDLSDFRARHLTGTGINMAYLDFCRVAKSGI